MNNNFKTFYKQYITENFDKELSLMNFLYFCKAKTDLVIEDRTRLIQIYKEGLKTLAKNKKDVVSDLINQNFNISSIYFIFRIFIDKNDYSFLW